ncbi:MAG: hypothetical protein M1153_02570 [Patescibacteria group bacterium]|nr:hypothetical protein [Patescibacteria group bacterium]
MPLIPLAAVVLTVLAGVVFSKGQLGGTASQPFLSNPVSAEVAMSETQSNALVNSNNTLSSPLYAYGGLVLADVSSGSLVGSSNPSGKTIKPEDVFPSYNLVSTSSILQTIAFKFNVPLSALQGIINGQ